MTSNDARALLLNGTVGVGKSTLAAAVAERLADAGVAVACLDVDDVRRARPAPAGDPFHHVLAMENLSCLAANFVRAGARRLVVAGVIETHQDLADHRSAVGMPLVTCRLTAADDVVRERLRARHRDDQELRWHLARAPELAGILQAAALDDHTLDVSALTVARATTETLDLIGWTP